MQNNEDINRLKDRNKQLISIVSRFVARNCCYVPKLYNDPDCGFCDWCHAKQILEEQNVQVDNKTS